MMRRSLLTYIASAGNLSPDSNRPFVHHPSLKEVEDALGLAEPGLPTSYLFS